MQRALAALGPLKANIDGYATEFEANKVAAREITRGIDRLVTGLGADRERQRASSTSGIAQTAAGRRSARRARPASSASARPRSTTAWRSCWPGSGELATGIDAAANGSERIGRGINRLLDAVVAVRRASDAQTRSLRRQGTDVNQRRDVGLLRAGRHRGRAAAVARRNASFAINTARGGNTARVIVVPEKGAFDEDTAALRPALERLADDAAKDMGADARSSAARRAARRLRPGDVGALPVPGDRARARHLRRAAACSSARPCWRSSRCC